MKKKVLLLITILIMCVMVLSACSQSISFDGGFENFDEDASKLRDWKEYKYTLEDDSKSPKYEMEFKTIDPNSVEGKSLVTNRYITMNVTSNYGVHQLRKDINLKQGKVYKLSYAVNLPADMSGANSKDFAGAFVGLLEGSTIKDFRVNTKTGGWVLKEKYFDVDRSGLYTLAVGVGIEGKGARGYAMFDNITLEEVESAPNNTTVLNVKNVNKSDGIAGGVTYTVLLTLVTIFLCFAAYFVIRKMRYKDVLAEKLIPTDSGNNGGGSSKKRKQNVEPNNDGDTAVAVPVKAKISGKLRAKKIFTSNYAIFSYVLLAVFFLRFIIVTFMSGMVDQLEDFARVALSIPDVGLSGIYAETSLPINFGFMYILAAIGGIGDMAGLTFDSSGMMMLVRLPFIIADLISYYLIYSFVGKHIGYKQSAVVAGLFALLPMIFTASSTWGMLLSISLPMMIGTVILMVNKRIISAIMVFTLALSFNTLMIVMLPVMIVYGLYYSVVVGIMDKVKAKKNGVTIPPSSPNKFKALLIDNAFGIKATVATIASLVLFWLASFPFSYNYVLNGEFFFIFDKAAAAIFTNPLVTNSVFNIYSMLGLGGATASTAAIAITSIVMVCLSIAGILAWLKSPEKNRLDFILLTAFAFIAYSMFGVGVKFDMMIVGIVMLLIYAVMRDDKRIFNIFTIYTVLTFINMGMLLVASKVFGTDTLYQNLAYDNWLYIMCSVFTLLTTVYFFKVMYDIMVCNYTVEIEPMKGSVLDVAKETKDNTIAKLKKLFKK